jgi:hypothetical protein
VAGGQPPAQGIYGADTLNDPRSNPFTGTVDPEPGAEPYHDFNEKIWAECYHRS